MNGHILVFWQFHREQKRAYILLNFKDLISLLKLLVTLLNVKNQLKEFNFISSCNTNTAHIWSLCAGQIVLFKVGFLKENFGEFQDHQLYLLYCMQRKPRLSTLDHFACCKIPNITPEHNTSDISPLFTETKFLHKISLSTNVSPQKIKVMAKFRSAHKSLQNKNICRYS